MTTVSEARTAAVFTAGLYRQRWNRWYAGRLGGDAIARLSLRDGRRDPYAIYEEIRADGAMTPTRFGDWATTSHAICSQVLRSRDFGVAPLESTPDAPSRDDIDLSLLSVNPPDHTRLRRVAAPAFTPRMMTRYAALVDETVSRLLDEADRKSTFDLVDDLAAPLPITVISRMLGLDEEADPAHVAALQRYGSALSSALDGFSSLGHARRVLQASSQLEAMFDELFARRESDPQDDLVSVLVSERGDRIAPDELVPLCTLLLVAGFETTVNLIGNAVRALLAHPDQWDLLRDDASLVPRAVEEVLRWDPPVQQTDRIAFVDSEIGGVRVAANQAVICLLAAANRDPDVFADPARFDVTRTSTVDHLSFSGGIHYCMGAPLARMQATSALTALVSRMPHLHAAGPVMMRSSTLIRGPRHLPVSASSRAERMVR